MVIHYGDKETQVKFEESHFFLRHSVFLRKVKMIAKYKEYIQPHPQPSDDFYENQAKSNDKE